jgi:hypothetical protein
MRTVKKNENVFAYNLRTDRDISKIPTDLDSADQCKNNPSKIWLHC